MKAAKTATTALGCAFLLFVAASARSQEAGFYVGASLGQVEHRDGCKSTGANLTVGRVPCDQKDSSWKLFAGYQVNRHFAAELGFADLGETSASGVFQGVTLSSKAEVAAWELVGIASLPVVARFSLYGKLGLYRAETEVHSSSFTPPRPPGAPMNIPGSGLLSESTQKKNNSDATFGIGARFDFMRSFAVRAEWQRYHDVEGSGVKGDIDVLGAGLLYRF